MSDEAMRADIERRLAAVRRQGADIEAAFNAGLALGRVLGGVTELEHVLAGLGEPSGPVPTPAPDDPPKEEMPRDRDRQPTDHLHRQQVRGD